MAAGKSSLKDWPAVYPDRHDDPRRPPVFTKAHPAAAGKARPTVVATGPVCHAQPEVIKRKNTFKSEVPLTQLIDLVVCIWFLLRKFGCFDSFIGGWKSSEVVRQSCWNYRFESQ